MFGTLVYTALDVGLNIVLWTTKTAYSGISYAYSYYTNEDNNSNDVKNNQKMLTYNKNGEISPQEILEMRTRIEEQTELLKDLKKSISINRRNNVESS